MYIRDTDGTIREPLLRGLDDIGSVTYVKANGIMACIQGQYTVDRSRK